MRTSGELIDPAHVCKAIYEKKGVVQYAADIVPCDVTTIYRLMKTNPEVKKAGKARAHRQKRSLES
jgi:hypothetical protein